MLKLKKVVLFILCSMFFVGCLHISKDNITYTYTYTDESTDESQHIKQMYEYDYSYIFKALKPQQPKIHEDKKKEHHNQDKDKEKKTI